MSLLSQSFILGQYRKGVKTEKAGKTGKTVKPGILEKEKLRFYVICRQSLFFMNSSG